IKCDWSSDVCSFDLTHTHTHTNTHTHTHRAHTHGVHTLCGSQPERKARATQYISFTTNPFISPLHTHTHTHTLTYTHTHKPNNKSLFFKACHNENTNASNL